MVVLWAYFWYCMGALTSSLFFLFCIMIAGRNEEIKKLHDKADVEQKSKANLKKPV